MSISCVFYTALVLCNPSVDTATTRVVAAHTAHVTPQVVFLSYAQPLMPDIVVTPTKKPVRTKLLVSSATKPVKVTKVVKGKSVKKRKALASTLEAYAEVEPQRKRSLFDVFFGKAKTSNTPTTSRTKLHGDGYRAVDAAARKYGVDPAFMHRVARQESGGTCSRTSSADARGVLQVIPGTARIHGVRNANKLYNCKIGAETGVREMKRLLTITKGDKRQALIGYNCGPACIGRKKLPRETRHYIAAIGAY